MVNGVLQIEINGETSTQQNIIAGLSNFQARAIMNDGTTKTSFTRNDDWSQLEALEITLSGTASHEKRPISRSLSARFFPRNILSK